MLLCRSWGGFFFPLLNFFFFLPWIASLGGLLASFIRLLWLQTFPNCCQPASSTTPLWPKQDIHDWLAWGSWNTSSYSPQQSCSLSSPRGLKYPVVLVSFLSRCTSAKAHASSCHAQGCFSSANCDRGFIWMACRKRWVKHSRMKSEGYLTWSWMKSWFSLACSTGVLHWALHICLRSLNNSNKLWCHLCSSVAISYDLVHDFFPLWVPNCSGSLCNWMGLFYFFRLPPIHTESSDLLILIGEKHLQPNSVFLLNGNFTSTRVAVVTRHNPDSHWRVFRWHRWCLDG